MDEPADAKAGGAGRCPQDDVEKRRFARVREVFRLARPLGAESRRASLDAACGGDAALRLEVEGLLAHHDAEAARDEDGEGGPAGPLAAGLRAVLEDVLGEPPLSAPAEPLPERIGAYRILRIIGTGGMGTVYEAEEDQPRRRVALKLVRPEIATAETRRRFEFEAQVLARLEHPGIARIYAMGRAETPAGPRPFIAMELVTGRPPGDYADGRRLGARERLELVARLCDAIAYAHQRGVIHRDLKPSNVLVDEGGQPKILDFGVARATEATAGTSLHTRYGRILGTLAYMSPEQAAGDPDAVDTRSDVYSLGVIAYELLCGRLPLAIDGRPLHVALREVVEREPPELGAVDPSLKGDVSILVSRAMAKERGRRYPSASAFADDIRRYLRDEPILARPPTAGYQARKFVRRHKGLVGGGAAALLALVGGLVLALALAHQREVERGRADLASTEALRSAYRAEIAAAAAALRGQDPVTARRRLDLADEGHRGWEWRHLLARLDPAVERLSLPSPPLAPLAWDEGLETLAASDDSGALRLLDASSPRPLRGSPEGAGRRLAFGAFVSRSAGWITADLEGEIRAWEADGRAPARVVARLRAFPSAFAVSRDGSRVLMATPSRLHEGAPIRLWILDGATGREVAAYEGPEARIDSASFAADGSVFATAGRDRSVRLWDAASARSRSAIMGHGNEVTRVAFSPDGLHLASGSQDRTARIWDAATGAETRRLKGHTGFVTDVVYSPDGRHLATASTDGTARLWDLSTGAAEAVVPIAEPDSPLVLGFDAACARLRGAGQSSIWTALVGAESGLDVLRGHRTGEEGNRYPYVYAVAWSPDGDRIASAGWDYTVRLWDPRTGRLLATLPCPDFVYSVAFAAGGRLVVAGCAGGTVLTWDAGTGAPHRVRKGMSRATRGPLACRSDGLSLIAAGEDGAARVLDAETLEDRGAWGGHSEPVFGAAYSADGRIAATVSADGTCLLRDASDGRALHALSGHEGPIAGVAFRPGRSQAATAGQDQTVRIWDTERGGEALRVLHGHTARVYAVAYSPDGSRIASGSNDNSIRLWDAETGDELLELTGHEAYVFGLGFSPGGETLASASGDDTVRLWSTSPLATRWAAAEAERALEREVEADVARRLAEAPGHPDVAVRAIEADPGLEPARRRAALAVALRLAAAR